MPRKKPEKDVQPVIKDVQPMINIGMVGHVDHGKTTLLERLSGKCADTHSEEIKRGITIRLGYADASFYICEKCSCYTTKEKCPKCGGKTKFLRKVSFVDAPGHESLMATMLAGATIMDAAILLVAATETCPQPQTREHLMALEIIGIKNIIIAQNKIDLLSEEEAIKNYRQIKDFIKNTPYENSAILPISAQHRVGIEFLIQAIEKHFPTPKRDLTKNPLMLIARSFDVNKPGTQIKELKGGVLGGSLLQGRLKIGEEIEIKPGYEVEERNVKLWKTIKTKIMDLNTGGAAVQEVMPGGSIGVMTQLDPSIVKSDRLSGSVAGLPGRLPKVWNELKLEVTLLKRVVGVKDELNVEPIKPKEMLMLNVNSTATVGTAAGLKKNSIEFVLKLPVCAEIGSRVTISRMINNRFRLIGYGIIS